MGLGQLPKKKSLLDLYLDLYCTYYLVATYHIHLGWFTFFALPSPTHIVYCGWFGLFWVLHALYTLFFTGALDLLCRYYLPVFTLPLFALYVLTPVFMPLLRTVVVIPLYGCCRCYDIQVTPLPVTLLI